MNVADFMRKWRESDLTERSGSQQHFCDLCELLGHPKPADADPKGEWFTFEKGATKPDGSDGWADVWKRGFFAWEYKGKHKDLDEAYKQLLKYRESLENPPLLVVCDMDRIVVHTNFTATAPKIHEVTLLGLREPENLEIIKAAFHEPEKLKPGVSREGITRQAADRLASVAQRMRDRGLDPHQVARFLDRIVFCLFAEDIGLLPDGVFSELLTEYRHEPEQCTAAIEELFHRMAAGGRFGVRRIKHFDGNLFEDVEVLPLEYEEIETTQMAARLDWSAVDATIFGTLFERGVDPAKRAQLGLHYTSRADIETLVEPVVMAPLRREWDELRATIDSLLTTGRKHVAQPPSAVGLARPTSGAYQRDLPHLQSEGKTYFVTFRTSRHLILPEQVRSLVVSHCLHDHGSKLAMHGLVVMPDHVHLVFTPLQDAEGNSFGLAEILSGIKGASAHTINKALGRRGHVWQDESFDHILRSDESTVSKVDYICQNPVRKGLVESEDDYPWLWREWVEGAPRAGRAARHPRQPAHDRQQACGTAARGGRLPGRGPHDHKTQPRAAVPHKPDSNDMPLFGKALDKAQHEGQILVHRFLQKLARLRVLDPACGSGNFLYVTLQKLKDLEKEVIVYATNRELGSHIPHVGPWQLHGIEISLYAFELAQLTVWIGYLQWLLHNGFDIPHEPILKPMHTFECKDAILDVSDPEHPKEPTWPKVDFIVGNPPFLGCRFLRRELGDEYVEALFGFWKGRVSAAADLCCYWFEIARAHIQGGQTSRAGLLATQGIRGGANRETLDRVKQTGDIFFAVSDRPWILDGASVHVSMVGFDSGVETQRSLDGRPVPRINSNLTSMVDVTKARRIPRLSGLAFMADTKGGAFDIDDETALAMMRHPTPSGRPNSDVIVPWVNGRDITQRRRGMWIIDFGVGMPEGEAAQYEAPFEYVREHVMPARISVRRETYRRYWWQHVEARPGMRGALSDLPRFLGTPRVTKHRLFVWLGSPTLPDAQLICFAGQGDSFFGILHSRIHEVWARAMGTQLRERESGFRYTPTTCFETFPFPEPTEEQAAAIAEAARELNGLRERWLNPPGWVREEVLEFPGSADGPWARYVRDPDDRGIGTIRYPRLVPRDADCARNLKARTLTNLYNQRRAWLDLAHEKLDAAVFSAYGWAADLDDEQVLERLLALNLERSAEGA